MTIEADLQEGIRQHAASRELWQQQSTMHEQARVNLITAVADELAIWGVRGSKTINVGANRDFKNIQSAFDSLSGKILEGDILIKVDDGVYNENKIELKNQPFAHRIKIEGNRSNPAACIINFVADSNKYSYGLLIHGLSGLRLAGFKLQGDTTANVNLLYRALYIERSSVICDANSIIIDKAYIGVEVLQGSKLICPQMRITNITSWAVWASDAGTDVQIYRCTISSNNGIVAQDCARLLCDGSSVSATSAHNGVGIFSTRQAYVHADTTIVSNFYYGLWSTHNSLLWCSWDGVNRTTAKNCVIGFLCDNHAELLCSGSCADACNHGFVTNSGSFVIASQGYAKNCGVGYSANFNSLLFADAVDAASTGNATKYSPPTAGGVGNNNSLIFWS